MKKVALFLVVLFLAVGAAAWVVYSRVQQPYRGYREVEQYVEVPPGSSTRAIGDRLIAAGVVRDSLTYRLALWMSGRARSLKAGEYRFDQRMTPLDVIGKLARGEVFVITLTFPEGQNISEMSAIYASHGLGGKLEFAEAAKNASLIHTIDPAARTLEGYLFPETYALSRKSDAAKLVKLMIDRFERILTPELRRATEDRGLSIHQLVVLASLVEKETARNDERPMVAAVYLNRFRIGMALQCDPTVIYALTREGKYTGNLRRDDLEFDSPYNTYKYPGLPPGPIASPGKASLEAVIHPADVEHLYFVSRNDGSHEFASTLAEHNQNVKKFQVDYFRAGQAGRAGRAGRPSH